MSKGGRGRRGNINTDSEFQMGILGPHRETIDIASCRPHVFHLFHMQNSFSFIQSLHPSNIIQVTLHISQVEYHPEGARGIVRDGPAK